MASMIILWTRLMGKNKHQRFGFHFAGQTGRAGRGVRPLRGHNTGVWYKPGETIRGVQHWLVLWILWGYSDIYQIYISEDIQNNWFCRDRICIISKVSFFTFTLTYLLFSPPPPLHRMFYRMLCGRPWIPDLILPTPLISNQDDNRQTERLYNAEIDRYVCRKSEI